MDIFGTHKMTFQHLEIEVKIDPRVHSIGTQDKPISLINMIITCTKPLDHHLPGADTRSYIDTDRSCNYSYPALEKIVTYDSLESYVTAYLDSMTDNKEWQKFVRQSAQLSLF